MHAYSAGIELSYASEAAWLASEHKELVAKDYAQRMEDASHAKTNIAAAKEAQKGGSGSEARERGYCGTPYHR